MYEKLFLVLALRKKPAYKGKKKKKIKNVLLSQNVFAPNN